MEFTHQKGDRYLIIGTDRSGKKFRTIYGNPYIAMAINLWQGRVYQLRAGKRTLIKVVF